MRPAASTKEPKLAFKSGGGRSIETICLPQRLACPWRALSSSRRDPLRVCLVSQLLAPPPIPPTVAFEVEGHGTRCRTVSEVHLRGVLKLKTEGGKGGGGARGHMVGDGEQAATSWHESC